LCTEPYVLTFVHPVRIGGSQGASHMGFTLGPFSQLSHDPNANRIQSELEQRSDAHPYSWSRTVRWVWHSRKHCGTPSTAWHSKIAMARKDTVGIAGRGMIGQGTRTAWSSVIVMVQVSSAWHKQRKKHGKGRIAWNSIIM
jgi:hypothetical protein